MGVEDCLNLNVFVPFESPGPLPVMVFIHGGAFIEGSGQEGTPDPLLDRDVIVVMINYRLGSLGFMTFGNNLVSGNMGLRDQLLALEWVKENIESFGGDPEQVTVFGESAGAISVHAHVLSPLGEGLYKNAIAQSGTTLMAILSDEGEREERFSFQLAVALDCSSTNHDEEMLACLQEVEIDKLLTVLSDPESLLQVSIQWWIVIDNYADQPFIPENPYKLMSTGKFKRIPYISGTLASEGGFMVSAIYDTLEETGENWDSVGAFFTGLTISQDPEQFTEKQKIIARLIKDLYTGNNFTRKNLNGLLKMWDHCGFLMPDQKSVSLMAQFNPNVFNYQITFKDTFSFTNYFKPGIDFGPSHADDLYYMFNGIYEQYGFSTNYTEKELEMSNIINEYWANFARFSDPTPPISNLPIWTPVFQNGNTNILELNLESKMKTSLDPDMEFFWEKLIWSDLQSEIEKEILLNS